LNEYIKSINLIEISIHCIFTKKMNRRNFLTISGTLTASGSLATLLISAATTPANAITDPANAVDGNLANAVANANLYPANAIATNPTHANPTRLAPIKAILFDAFVIFDPSSVSAAAARLFPQQATSLMSAWRTKIFEYTWLRSLAGIYTDMETVISDALAYATAADSLSITKQQHEQLVGAFSQLETWPDVQTMLTQLKASGYRLGFLSDFTPEMLRLNTQKGQLTPHFEHLLSVDKIRTYKPDPRSYQLGMDDLQLKKDEILFAASAGWDAAGAKSFGYPTFWVNRLMTPAEHLGVTPDGTGNNLQPMLDWLTANKRSSARCGSCFPWSWR
jgi:2-haloacid dehalogenase